MVTVSIGASMSTIGMTANIAVRKKRKKNDDAMTRKMTGKTPKVALRKKVALKCNSKQKMQLLHPKQPVSKYAL